MHSSFIKILSVLLGAAAAPAPAQPAVGPSVRDVVEFTQIIQPVNQNDDELHEQASPDAAHTFIVTRQANVDSDKNHYEIRLLDIRPEQLAAQRAPAPVTVFVVDAPQDNAFMLPAIKDVHWHGNRTLVFLARLNGDRYQVYSLDLPARKLTQLTHETKNIVSYAASKNLQRVVYAVQVPNPPLKDGAHDVVVGRRSFWSVKFGQQDLRSQDRIFQYLVADSNSPQPPIALGDAHVDQSTSWPVVSISPDGRWAVLPRWEPERLAAWEHDYPMVAELARTYSHSQQVDPLGYFSTPSSYVPRRMTAWRLDDGKEQTIVDAPDDALPGSSQIRSDRIWQGTGESLVIAGTHLPLDLGDQRSPASHVIEYWPDTGRWAIIGKLRSHLDQIHALSDGFVMIDGAARREFHRQTAGGWREEAVGESGHAAPSHAPAWTLHIVQGLNQPPDVYAAGPAGEKTRLTALTPQFDADTWGAMQPYAWHDVTGARWDGGLMSGAGMDVHTRYPLVIQTYGFDPNRFFIGGANWADGFTSAFPGRAFLREGILVLQMPFVATGTRPDGIRAVQAAFDRGIRSAIDTLVREGRVDPAKIGVIGWSATGQRVLNLVTFADVPIRAATLADGDENSVFALTVTYGKADSMWADKQESNDGLPFGETMPMWVRNDPAMHTDCVQAALRIESYGPWVLNNWDLYAMLRRQYKAAEMVMIPGGTHSLTGPRDRIVSLQGNVDWYDFWLSGKKRTAPLTVTESAASVADQYSRWQQMASLKTADEARSRCRR